MQKLMPNDPETTSLNGLTENLTRLHDLFPEAFTEGRLNFDILRELLADQIDDQPEKYGLNWNGKARARRHALTPTRATLRPDKDSSVDWDTTQNLMIEGDNLEVLKLLQRSYAGKVKLIYIDPPYNTGKDFVYPDNYMDSLRNYQQITGQTEDGRRVSSNAEGGGRFHTDWLNMIYPRIKLARDLLREDGVVFISIDDAEVANLKNVLNEIFGEENFIGHIVWQKKYGPANDAKGISQTHEHILAFARNSISWIPALLERSESQLEAFKNPDNDPRGLWRPSDLSARTFSESGYYKIVGPTGLEFYPPASRAWICNENRFKELLDDGRITFGLRGDGRPMQKKFLSEVKDGITPETWWSRDKVGDNKTARYELKELIENNVFDTPKPSTLISYIIKISNTNTNDLILDFFAGSGTTGHSVMAQNATDGGNRQFILVQLPEPLDPNYTEQKTAADFCDSLGVPRTIAELTKERLRRAGAKVKAESPMFSGDTGFRVFKLDSSNVTAWDESAARADLPAALQFAENNIKPDRTEWDVLYEVLLKLGLPLTTPIEERTIAGHTVQLVGGGSLMACLSREIQGEAVQELGQGMADWLAAEDTVGDSHILFLDSAFRDDSAKLNLSTYLLQRVATLSPKRNWVVRSL